MESSEVWAGAPLRFDAVAEFKYAWVLIYRLKLRVRVAPEQTAGQEAERASKRTHRGHQSDTNRSGDGDPRARDNRGGGAERGSQASKGLSEL